MNRGLLLLVVLAASPLRAAVEVKETGRVRRPFSWQTTKLSADFVRFSADSLKNGGPEGIMVGLLGFVFTVPMTLLSPPVDLIAAPFRKRRFIRWEIDARVIDEVGGPLRETSVRADCAGLRVTVEGRQGYEVFRSSISATTDGEGRFSISGTGYFGPNKDVLVRVSAGSPLIPVSTVRFRRKGRRIVVESADDSIAGRYRLDPPFPSERWDD